MLTSLTGLRIGELCGLRWANIDLDEEVIHVREQVLNDKTNHTLVHTSILKTNSACRSISIPKSLVTLLKEHKANQISHADFVILDTNNKMCNPRNVSMRFTQAVNRYIKSHEDDSEQLPKISIHGLRHTHATILLLKGENIKVISERLGHTSVKITLDTYSHVLPSMRKNTALLLDNIFNL